MTNKEHLEGVKELIDKYENCYDKDIALKYAMDLMRYHARYFVKQAERVKELEKENDRQKKIIDHYSGTIKGAAVVNGIATDEIKTLREQNKRYREVIEKAIDDLENECLWDALVRLKALEGDE